MVNNQNEFSFDRNYSVGYVQKALGISNVSEDSSRCDVFGISAEELTIGNFKDNGKRIYCDDNPDDASCKRVKQIKDVDSIEGSPPSDEVACSGFYDLPWETWSSPIWAPTFPNSCDYQIAAPCSKVKETRAPVREPSPVHEHLGHKAVAIGPNHQALIPDWNTPSVNSNDSNSEKWIKYCVSPLNDLDPFLSRNICCDCPDEGSTRCVRQHITEAREDLRRVFGQEKFEKLGFCDMGEEVALKWTAEEEKLFQEVVSSNPQSMDKNFWDDLPCAFPNKSSRDLVSYYFNVFILRKRAAQNRWDPTHIDSDDDEWEEPENKSQMDEQDEEEEEEEEQEEQEQEHEEDEEDEEENESAIDSLSDQDDFMCNNDVREDCSEQSTEDEYYQSVVVGEKKEENYFDFGILNEDGNTDSCTSFDESFHRVDAVNGFGVISHDGIFDDLKVWDIDFPNGNGLDDFLSTCNVVDQVIGMEAWDNCDIGRDDAC